VLIEKDFSVDEGASADPDREYLAAIARYAADAIIGLDAGGRIRSWNRGAEQAFGYLADEALGRTMEFLVPDNPNDRRIYDDLQKECT